MSDASVQDLSGGGVEIAQVQSCPAVAHQDICVEANVTIIPRVTPGSPRVICRGPALIGPCPGEDSPTGKCSFTVNQNVCVQIPLLFDARASATQGRVVCGLPSPTPCPPVVG
ncbi:MAG TPA: hypothetical protein VGK74_26600 [Symbiobacteriaceae bacterium]|jgi:hypothetical protein